LGGRLDDFQAGAFQIRALRYQIKAESHGVRDNSGKRTDLQPHERDFSLGQPFGYRCHDSFGNSQLMHES
jgi:hypothetical protein